MGLTRRIFVIGTAAIAGGIAVGWYAHRQPHDNPLLKDAKPGDFTPNPYVSIAGNGEVTIIVPRAEMGQGVMTTLGAMVAEELNLPLAMVRIEHGPASSAYFNAAVMQAAVPFHLEETGLAAEIARSSLGVAGKFMGLQWTGGSTSTVDAFDPMRLAGAAARAVLAAAAATKLGARASALEFAAGRIIDPASGKSVGFGDIAAEAARVEVPSSVKPKDPKDWTQLGKPLARVDVPSKTDGTAKFGIDTFEPGMLFATIRMNPAFGAPMKSFDATPAKAVPGVIDVVDMSTGIGVIAKDTWAAFKGAEAAKIVWGAAAYPKTTKAIFAEIARAAKAGGGWALRDDGDAPDVLEKTSNVIEATYQVPYLAHACMEPMNATARLKNGELDIWLGTQAPTVVVDLAKAELGLEANVVRVHTTLLGGGFGRRFEPDFAAYAMRLAKHAEGRMIKVTWSREEDATHDTYRPGSVALFRGVMGKNGTPEALSARVAGQGAQKSTTGRLLPWMPWVGPDPSVTEGSHNQPYSIANYRVESILVELGIPVGLWRSVGNSSNSFFHECFLDELARSASIDPVAMRLKMLAKAPWAAKTVETAAQMAGWDKPLPEGRGRGFAFTASFGSYVAQAIEVSQTDDGIRIDKVFAALDCGRALDPGILKAQIESGILYGLSAAMSQEITFEDGAVQETNFDTFDAIRINQSPKIEVAILENAPRMGGAGEPGTPPSLPALANAVFDLTGKRIRQLPLGKHVDFV